jgi:hypothetical protein
MSTDLGYILNTGSRNVELKVTQYGGGIKNGLCLQISGITAEGTLGYVQLNKKDISPDDEIHNMVMDWLKAHK